MRLEKSLLTNSNVDNFWSILDAPSGECVHSSFGVTWDDANNWGSPAETAGFGV